jgi:hypothetical protein
MYLFKSAVIEKKPSLFNIINSVIMFMGVINKGLKTGFAFPK